MQIDVEIGDALLQVGLGLGDRIVVDQRRHFMQKKFSKPPAAILPMRWSRWSWK
jgi:hypothetical protein